MFLGPDPDEGASGAKHETHGVHDHDDGESLDLGVGLVGEVPDDPPVAILDELNEDSEEEEAHDQNARAVETAALSNRVHSLSSSNIIIKAILINIIFKS